MNLSLSNSLNPDQARHLARPDLGPNCLRGYQQMRLNLLAYLSSADFLIINFLKKFFRNTTRVSSNLDPNQVQHFLNILSGLICLQTVCKGYEQTTIIGKDFICKTAFNLINTLLLSEH